MADVTAVADFRAALRRFLRQSERVARQYRLTPQRYLLLLMIKGSPGGKEQSTVTELSELVERGMPRVWESLFSNLNIKFLGSAATWSTFVAIGRILISCTYNPLRKIQFGIWIDFDLRFRVSLGEVLS